MLPSVIVAALAIVSVAAIPATVKRSQDCPPLALFFACGTNERLGAIGGPLGDQLAAAIPGAQTSAISYNSDPEYVISVYEGAQEAANDAQSFNVRCPDSKIAFGGYSKGAEVVRNTKLTKITKDQVIGVVVFGDPYNKDVIQAPFPINDYRYVFKFCNVGDPVCNTDGLSIPAHLAYGTDGSTNRAVEDLAAALRDQS